jgi:glycosyltransferase involved in cell wall biosynthesis
MAIKICLNMIVKNEAKIILRCLKSVSPYISTWVIHDTQSTDDTVELIRGYFASEKKIGRIVENVEFKNFEYNRNAALADAKSEDVDYILLLDADMEFRVQTTPDQFLETLISPAYRLCQKNTCLSYNNTRLVGKDLFALSEYSGVTHEYIGTGSCQPTTLSDSVAYIYDHGDGGCKADKFVRDKRLLEQDTLEFPTKSRSWFYLAQTYKDLGEWKNALDAYKHYLTLSGWPEETWYAKYMIVKCHIAMGNTAEAVQSGMEAFEERPHRSEPLYLLTKLCREKAWNNLAWTFGTMGLRIPFPTQDSLFIDNAIYSSKFLYELSIVAFYVDKKKQGLDISNYLLLHQEQHVGIDDGEFFMLKRNFDFYIQPLSSAIHTELTIDGMDKNWTIMNPGMCYHGGDLHINARSVNYWVNKQLQYGIQGSDLPISFSNPARTRNFDAVLQEGKLIMPQEVTFQDKHLLHHPDVCLGYEDLRLFVFDDEIWFLATSRELSSIRTNCMVLGTKTGEKLFKLKSPNWQRCEKNWLPFEHKGKLLIIYQYQPFTIFEVDPTTGEYEITKQDLYPDITLAGFRGGAPPVRFKDGYIFVVHEVLPHYSASRNYTHRFVQLSGDLQITHISEAKHIRGKEPIEYVSGMAIIEETAYLTWGEMDAKAFLTTIPIQELISEKDKIYSSLSICCDKNTQM